MQLVKRLSQFFVPGPANSYRPPALSKSTVALFLAITLVAEGSFVLNLFNANPSQTFFAAVAAAPVTTGGAPGQVGRVVKLFSIAASNPMLATTFVLGVVAVALAILIGLAVFKHAHIQPHDLVLPALVVMGIALVLLALNAWYAGAYVA